MTVTASLSWYGGSAGEPAPVRNEFITFGRSDIQGNETGQIALMDGILWPAFSFGQPGGTSYSYVQQMAIEVTVASSPPTTLVNASFSLTSDLPSGWLLFFKGNSQYLDQTAVSQGPADLLTDNLGQPATPDGYMIATTLPQVWDLMGTPDNGAVLGRVSIFLDLVFGVSSASIYQGSEGTLNLPAGIVSFGELV